MARIDHAETKQGSAFSFRQDRPPPPISQQRPACDGPSKDQVIGDLRQMIRRIEGRGPMSIPSMCEFAAGPPSGLPAEDGSVCPRNAHPAALPSSASLQSSCQSSGQLSGQFRGADHCLPKDLRWPPEDDRLDDLFGVRGLKTDAVHEIKSAISVGADRLGANWAASWSAARRFLLGLVVCRLRAARRSVAAGASTAETTVLWCWPRNFAQEFGELYAPGLFDTGMSRDELIIVEPGHARDVLWAVEEGLKSPGIGCVVGVIDDVALTPARRLALAAQKYSRSCFMLTHPRRAPMAATGTRWRVAPIPSALHPAAADLPGNPRLCVTLERHREVPLAETIQPIHIEWCARTMRFRQCQPLTEKQSDEAAAGFWCSS